MTYPKSQSHGITLKKKHGQHFLRQEFIARSIVDRVPLTHESSVFEIGCGDGYLTQFIVEAPIARLWVFEIDPEWARHVRHLYEGDLRVQVFEQNILDIETSFLEPHAPWTLLANLPYQITFPILYLLHKNRHLLREGVIMVQEEVAQKIVKNHGRGYGFSSLFFQHYFEWELMAKIPPTAFFPPPKVYSRLLYFKPRAHVQKIVDEDGFWKFVKLCFRQPRRTLRNNLAQSHYALDLIPDELLGLRAQQMDKQQLIAVWQMIKKSPDSQDSL